MRSDAYESAVPDGVDAEQGLGQAEALHDGTRGGAWAEDVEAPGRMPAITSVAMSLSARSSPATPPALALWVRPRA